MLFRHVAGPGAELSQFALAMQVLVLASALPTAFGQAALPVLSRAVQRGDGKELTYFEGMSRLGIVLAVALGLAALTAAAAIVEILFGSSYLGADHLVAAVVWLMLAATLMVASSQVLIARGHYTWPIPCAFAGALVMSASIFPLASELGPQGAIIAASAGLVVSAALHVALMVRSGGIDFGIAIVRPGVCAALAVGVYWGLATIAPWPALLAALVVFGVGMVVLGGLRRSERGALRTALLRPLRLLPARGRS